MAERGLPWQEKAKNEAVWDYSIKLIIDKIDNERTRDIKGKKFPDATRDLAPFAVADQKIIYMPSWYENCFEPYEFEWIVFHEVCHIINNHKYENPLDEDYIADKCAARLQCRIDFGIYALTKISEMEMRRARRLREDPEINIQILRRINRLKKLTFLCK